MANIEKSAADLMQAAKKHAKDTGSVAVQATLLTSDIKRLTEHFKVHKKDKHSKYGLQKMVNQRKKLLKYLKRKNHQDYKETISLLGLRDSY